LRLFKNGELVLCDDKGFFIKEIELGSTTVIELLDLTSFSVLNDTKTMVFKILDDTKAWSWTKKLDLVIKQKSGTYI